MKRFTRLSLWIKPFCLLFLCVFPKFALAGDVTVFAASSLRDALGTLAAEYERETGEELVLVFAASSALARQVAQGAPADVVLFADQDWGDWLINEGVIRQTVPFAGNRMVLVAQNANAAEAGDLATTLGTGLIAMAQIEAVPAGRYGKAALDVLGLWEDVAPRVVQAANVRAALRFVQRGEAEFGIGYASDLVALPDLKQVHEFAPDTHPEIVYVGATFTPAGAEFMTYMQSVTGQDILGDWGFAPAPDRP